MRHDRQNIAVAVSGSGRTLENLLKLENSHHYKICGVISSHPTCRGQRIAKDLHLPVFLGDFQQPTKKMIDDLYGWLENLEVYWVVLAGFIKLFPCKKEWFNRIINIHPALLPKCGGKGMYGMNVHRLVLASKDEISGASVHFVNERYDEGQIISQIKVPVNKNDTAISLAARVFEAECKLYPLTIDDLIGGELPLANGIKLYEL